MFCYYSPSLSLFSWGVHDRDNPLKPPQLVVNLLSRFSFKENVWSNLSSDVKGDIIYTSFSSCSKLWEFGQIEVNFERVSFYIFYSLHFPFLFVFFELYELLIYLLQENKLADLFPAKSEYLFFDFIHFRASFRLWVLMVCLKEKSKAMMKNPFTNFI